MTTKYKPGQFAFWKNEVGDSGNGIIEQATVRRTIDGNTGLPIPGQEATMYKFKGGYWVDEKCIDLAMAEPRPNVVLDEFADMDEKQFADIAAILNRPKVSERTPPHPPDSADS